MLRGGGKWLGCARQWIQAKCRNGEHVTWGTHDKLEGSFTVYDIETLARHVAEAAVAEYDKRHASALKRLIKAVDSKNDFNIDLALERAKELFDA